MGHTYHSLNFHVIFAMRDRRPVLRREIREMLFPYNLGIAHNHDFVVKAVGGVDDHIHLLLSLRPVQAPAKVVQGLKSITSKWIHETFPSARNAWWQDGYGIFSISHSHMDATVEYIRNQETHHKKRSFRSEFEAILRKHGLKLEEAWIQDDGE